MTENLALGAKKIRKPVAVFGNREPPDRPCPEFTQEEGVITIKCPKCSQKHSVDAKTEDFVCFGHNGDGTNKSGHRVKYFDYSLDRYREEYQDVYGSVGGTFKIVR